MYDFLDETDYKFTFVGFNHIEKARSKNATIRQLNVFMEPVTHVDDRKTVAAMFPQVQVKFYSFKEQEFFYRHWCK